MAEHQNKNDVFFQHVEEHDFLNLQVTSVKENHD